MQPQEEPGHTGVWQGPGGLVFEFATAANLNAPALKVLFAYWVGKCGGRFAPTREDINPKDIPSILPNIHMHEVLDGGRAFARACSARKSWRRSLALPTPTWALAPRP